MTIARKEGQPAPSPSTEEFLRPEVEGEDSKGFWQRLWGGHAHCWHENPRWHSPERGVLVRICCHCGRNERAELVPADHGTYHPTKEEIAKIWSPWKRWRSPEQTGGSYY